MEHYQRHNEVASKICAQPGSLRRKTEFWADSVIYSADWPQLGLIQVPTQPAGRLLPRARVGTAEVCGVKFSQQGQRGRSMETLR